MPLGFEGKAKRAIITAMKINIVLFQPEIPQNTGNIARTCSATGSALHLVHPLGFSLDEKHLRRAGLDYWDGLDITQYEDDEDFFSRFALEHDGDPMFFLSQKGAASLWETDFWKGVPSCPDFKTDVPVHGGSGSLWLAFGRESRGLDDSMLEAHRDHCIRIPMIEGRRSLNLSNAVAVTVYEALRQAGGLGLKQYGMLWGNVNA